MKIVWSPRARRRVRNVCNYIAHKFYPDCARTLRADIVDTAVRASEMPGIGREAFPGHDCPDILKLLCSNRRVWVYYRIVNDTCEILSVRHALQSTTSPCDL